MLDPSFICLHAAFLNAALINIVDLLTPGPDFVIVVRNAITYSRAAGYRTALGMGLAEVSHVVLASLGLALALKTYPWLYHSIKWLGVAYFLYLAYDALRTKSATIDIKTHSPLTLARPGYLDIQDGFFSNALNPRTTIFYISVFSTLLQEDTSLQAMLFYIAWFPFTITTWYCLVSRLFAKPFLQRFLLLINRISGVILLMAAIALAVNA